MQEKRPSPHQVQQESLEKADLPSRKDKTNVSTKSSTMPKSSGNHVRFSTDHHSPLKEKSYKEQDSSESETENTTFDDEKLTCEKYLLLIDQPSIEQKAKRHLTIKDIGVILERLSSKIIDVEKLEREVDEEYHNWTIKAVIKGETLRELGVLYGGHYYTICEHPNYESSTKPQEGDLDDDEEEETKTEKIKPV